MIILKKLETDTLRYTHHIICKVYNHNTSEQKGCNGMYIKLGGGFDEFLFSPLPWGKLVQPEKDKNYDTC